jgi:hypothetical protein
LEKQYIQKNIKNLKYLGIYLSMKVKDLYSENYKSPKNENEDDISSWMFVLASWIGRISMIKMAILLKAINMFNKIIIKMGKKSKGIIYRDKKKPVLKFI